MTLTQATTSKLKRSAAGDFPASRRKVSSPEAGHLARDTVVQFARLEHNRRMEYMKIEHEKRLEIMEIEHQVVLQKLAEAKAE